MSHQSLRTSVAAASRRLADEGLLVGTSGNVSAREGAAVAITPTGAVLGDLSADQVSVIDLDGRVIAGDLAPTSELALHLGIYERYDAGAVVHCHAPVSTALSCVIDELPCLHYQQLLLGGAVRVAPYATFGTPELAVSVLDALQDRSAALMANHGSVTHAATLDAAVEHAVLLEWLACVYRDARLLGEPRTLDESQQAAVVEAALSRGYGSTRPASPTGVSR